MRARSLSATTLLALGIALGGVSASGVAEPHPSPVFAAGEACNAEVVNYTSEVPEALTTLQSSLSAPIATGAGVTVAVVDSGIDVRNEHLANVVLPGKNFVGDGEPADARTDLAGHGTAIAGQIAAQALPASGVVGLAPGARLLPVRVFRGDDEQTVKAGFGPDTGLMAEGIRWAAEQGAQIINVSMSVNQDSPVLHAAVLAAREAGSLVVASAGNRDTASDKSDGIRYPAGYDEVLGVTATTVDGVVNDDSVHGPQVDVAAPGMNVLTTSFAAGDCMYANEQASSSFSTAYASAAAALLAQAHPAEGPDGWKYRLEATASRAHPDARDDVNGWGLIQPYEALTLVADGTIRGPASPLAERVLPQAAPEQHLDLRQEPSLLAATRSVGLWAAVIAGTLLAVILLLRRRRMTSETTPE